MRKFLKPSNIKSSIFQLSLPVALYLGATSGAGLSWWFAALFFFIFVYSIYGNCVGLHRCLTHGHFTVSRPIEFTLAYIGSLIGLGDPLSYAITHAVHHKHSDTELDPHGRIRGLKSVLVYFQKTVDTKETPMFSRRIIELSTKYRWMHEYYLLLVLGTAGVLCLIDFKLMLFLWWIPASASCWLIAWTVVRQHLHLTPNNSPIHKIDFVYEGLHLNHHLHPMAPNTAIRPGEIDWAYQFSRLLKPKYDFRMQPGYKNEKQ